MAPKMFQHFPVSTILAWLLLGSFKFGCFSTLVTYLIKQATYLPLHKEQN